MPLQYTLLGFSYYYPPPPPRPLQVFPLSLFFQDLTLYIVLDITALENNNYTSPLTYYLNTFNTSSNSKL